AKAEGLLGWVRIHLIKRLGEAAEVRDIEKVENLEERLNRGPLPELEGLGQSDVLRLESATESEVIRQNQRRDSSAVSIFLTSEGCIESGDEVDQVFPAGSSSQRVHLQPGQRIALSAVAVYVQSAR